VLGTVTESGKVDEEQLQRLLGAAKGLDVTFHRAFDAVDDQMTELETILKYDQIKTILTTGGADRATEASSKLAALVERTKNTSLTIMPGMSIVPDNIANFYELVIPDALQFGSGVRLNSIFDCTFSEDRINQNREETI